MACRNTSILYVVAIIAQCALLTTGLITLQSVSDGPCVHVKALAMEDLDFDWALQFTSEPGFVPMASQAHYVFTTKMLTGSEPQEWSDVNKMCPKIESGIFDSTMTGYGKRAELACEIQGVGIVDCYLKNDPTRSNSSIIITYSDNNKYMVTISCLPGNLKSWNVISTETSVDEASRKKILNHVMTYGFDPEKTVQPTFETC